MASERLPGVYVRLANPSEHKAAARVLTRAFARDPAMNWYGCVKEMVPDCNSSEPHAVQTIERLHCFQTAILKLTHLLGGVITVAVIPQNGNSEDDQTKDNSGGQEKIVGVTLWLKPGQSLDFGLGILIRSGIYKVLYGWGIEGVKRVLIEFSPAVERTLENAFNSRRKSRMDSWHLLEMVVDPVYEGKDFQGVCSIMMKEGFKRTEPKPVHLEATKARTRDIYARFGFEVDEEHQFGRGKVDTNGLKAKGEAATGYPEWVMTKVKP
ncbi:hypothetical protein ACEPAH_3980 [Sanghuangporus vaninii]